MTLIYTYRCPIYKAPYMVSSILHACEGVLRDLGSQMESTSVTNLKLGLGAKRARSKLGEGRSTSMTNCPTKL